MTHNAHEVTLAVLCHHLPPAILVRDDGPQAATQHNEGGVCGLPLPGRHSNTYWTVALSNKLEVGV